MTKTDRILILMDFSHVQYLGFLCYFLNPKIKKVFLLDWLMKVSLLVQ